jgi:ABC-2 type transport system ATP-binding protein
MNETYEIETRDLTKHFTSSTNLINFFPRTFKKKHVVKAVDRVHIKIKRGEVSGLLGPNGVGKITLIKMLSTMIIPTRGKAYIDGYEIVKNGEKVRRIIGLVTGEERSFYWRFSGKENLKFFGTLYNMRSKEIQKKVDYFVELLEMKEYIDMRFDDL